MATTGVGQRYARAVFEIAQETHDLDGWLADLQRIRAVLSEPAISALLENPGLTFEQKQQIVQSTLEGLGEKRLNLIWLLIQNHRTGEIGAIARGFENLLNQVRGVAVANVRTAVPIGPAEAEQIADQLGRALGRRIVIRTTVDPSIVGGFVARVGDQMIDGSVVGRLSALRNELLN